MGKVDYKALLEDSKRQRAELDAVIAFAERQLGIAKNPSSTTAPATSTGSSVVIEDDTFHGKNILQASEAYLHMVGRPARSTEEIAAAISKGGVPAAAASVATILGRSKGSSINRVKRGLWGLKEWYSTT
ncbi:MAG TPA: hypothetical protein VMD77_11810 [Candidatus Baltobacteraceae bacterium]|nr:hypothetical protein [Candidatus Baltobacteraceae bacterium]